MSALRAALIVVAGLVATAALSLGAVMYLSGAAGP